MIVKIAILMDPIESIDPKHDTTFLFFLAAQQRGWEMYYFQQHELYADNGIIKATVRKITVEESVDYFQLSNDEIVNVGDFDFVLMRKDPPFNMEFIYSTYLLELAEAQGAKVFNSPQSLRDANEKMFTLWFPELCPPTVVTCEKHLIKHFAKQQGDIILKPIDGMGGRGIFLAKQGDPNLNSMIEMLSNYGSTTIMAQQYQPEIRSTGDRRILLINGEPVSHALVRIAAEQDFRGNIAANATTQVAPLSDAEQKICQQLGPVLKQKGLLFVGLDVIGDKITEINVTSPTGAHELNNAAQLDIGTLFIDSLAAML